MLNDLDALVIGAGQTGLAAAYYLHQRRATFVVLDERAAVGDVWASRFRALTLFSPAWASGLPGLSWPGNPFRYPTKDEAADYLRAYAEHFRFPIRLGQHVARVTPAAGGTGYAVHTKSSEVYRTRRVIVCTGAYQAPFVPAFAATLHPTIVQLHSSAYQQPAQLPGLGPVAVVGSGNSALQIAADLAGSHRPVYAAFDERTPALPNNMAMWAFLTATGLLRASRDGLLGRRLIQRPEPVVSSDLSRLREFTNVHFIGRASSAGVAGSGLHGTHGTTPPLQAVVWATGFRPDYSWLNVPVFDTQGYPLHHRGLTTAPGLAFLGLPWLSSRSSALMNGAGPDARYVVAQLLKST